MAVKTINNFAIDHVLRGIMTKKNGEYMWSINEITGASLNVTTENSQVVNAIGSVIVEYDRARNAEFSAENSLFDLGLYAAQMGQEKKIASAESTFAAPAFEEFEYDGAMTTYVTKEVPNDPITTIYLMNGDGTLGQHFKAGTAPSDTEFAYDEESHTITLPTGLEKGDYIFVMYEYECTSGVEVTVDGVNFPKAGKFYLEVLGSDTCDPDTLIHAYVRFNNAKLDGNVDYTFESEGTHPFTIRAMQDYCDREKRLFSIIIPNED